MGTGAIQEDEEESTASTDLELGETKILKILVNKKEHILHGHRGGQRAVYKSLQKV